MKIFSLKIRLRSPNTQTWRSPSPWNWPSSVPLSIIGSGSSSRFVITGILRMIKIILVRDRYSRFSFSYKFYF